MRQDRVRVVGAAGGGYDFGFDPVDRFGLADQRLPREEFEGDPSEDARKQLRERLDRWMEATDDPLRHGHVDPPPGAEINLPTQTSPEEPTWRAG